MHTLSIDYRLGYRYACEMLHDMSVNKIDALTSGRQNWKQDTADNLITAANQRKADGINPAYQDGVIARACLDLEG